MGQLPEIGRFRNLLIDYVKFAEEKTAHFVIFSAGPFISRGLTGPAFCSIIKSKEMEMWMRRKARRNRGSV